MYICITRLTKKATYLLADQSQIDCFYKIFDMTKLDGFYQLDKNKIKCSDFDLLVMSRKQTTPTKTYKFLLIQDHSSKAKTYCSSMYPLQEKDTYKIDFQNVVYTIQFKDDQVLISNQKSKV